MQLALNEAWKYQFLTYPNPAVGALIIKNNQILSISAHKEAGEAHAEVNAIKEAYYKLTKDRAILSLDKSLDIHNYLYKNHNNLFTDCEIFVTLEPCHHYGKTPPCSLLIKNLKFKKLYIATRDINPKATGSVEFLKANGIDLKVGILEDKAKELLYPFKKWSESRFVFFKYAQSLNGVISGGYISSKESLKFVHQLRDKTDLLTIGGNTVRVDRPTLDTRAIENGKNPDILIYSRENSNSFDRDIPLFNIKDREVFIENSLDKLDSYNFIMIEGGEAMLRACQNYIDWYLVFIAPKYMNRDCIKPDLNLNILHSGDSGVDLKIFANSI